MRKNYFQLSLLIIFCLSLSCAHVQPPYILSHLPQIQELEKQDHKFCAGLKLSFDQTDPVKSSLYWRCRLSMAKYKLYTNSSIPEYAKHNLDVTDLIGKISFKISDTPEALLTSENKKLDNIDDIKCREMGFKFRTENQIEVDDYFACRKALIENRKFFPAFGNKEYLKKPNNSYNIGFVIDLRIDQRMKEYEEAKEKYPTCIKFNLLSVDFKNCTAAMDKSRQCFAEVNKKKFKKELEEKVSCQKLAYKELPDSFLKENAAEKERLQKMNESSDYQNQNSFAAIGITDMTDFDSDDDRVIAMKEKELKEKREKEELQKEINSKNGLYDKHELTILRKRYIFFCQKDSEPRINHYVDGLKENCKKMEEFKLVSDD